MGWKKHHTACSPQNSTLKQTAQWGQSSAARRLRRVARQSPYHGEAKAIGTIVVRLVSAILGNNRLDESTLLMQWSVIVGNEMAAVCSPIRLAFHHKMEKNGTLHLKVINSSFAVELQHRSVLLIERINTYFGRPMVGQIRITQGVLPQKLPSQKLPSPLLSSPRQKVIWSPAEEAALMAELAPIHDDALREALIRLGRHILSHTQEQQGTTDVLDEGGGQYEK